MKKFKICIIGLIVFVLATIVSMCFNFSGKDSVLYADETVEESFIQTDRGR